MKLGVVLPNWIGDVVMATPTLRALRQRVGPGGRLVGVMRPYVAQVLSGLPWFDETIYYDYRLRNRSLGSWAAMAALRAERLDAAVLLPNSLRAAMLARLAGIGRRIGYAGNGRNLLLTDRIIRPRDAQGPLPIAAVEHYLRLAEATGCRDVSRRLQLATTSQEEAAAERVWKRLGLDRAGRVVALHVCGAAGTARHWPVEHAVQLARRLTERPDTSVAVFCGPQERDQATAIQQQAAHRRVVSITQPTVGVGVSKACLRRCALLITTDSGPRHIAAALGVPVVALFGPTDPRLTETGQLDSVHLRLPLACSPCSDDKCRFGHHDCMRHILPERVAATAERLLAEPAARREDRAGAETVQLSPTDHAPLLAR